MPKPEEITQKMQQIHALMAEIIAYTKAENFTARMFAADQALLIEKKQKLIQENEDIQRANEEASKEADKIIALAKDEADKIIAIARENLVAANMERQKAKLELQKAQDSRYLAEKQVA